QIELNTLRTTGVRPRWAETRFRHSGFWCDRLVRRASRREGRQKNDEGGRPEGIHRSNPTTAATGQGGKSRRTVRPKNWEIDGEAGRLRGPPSRVLFVVRGPYVC